MRFKSCDTCLCACAFQQRARDRELCIVSCLGGGGWVAVTRDFERHICVTSEILQSDWILPNPKKVPRPSFVRESREGLGQHSMGAPPGLNLATGGVVRRSAQAQRTRGTAVWGRDRTRVVVAAAMIETSFYDGSKEKGTSTTQDH